MKKKRATGANQFSMHFARTEMSLSPWRRCDEVKEREKRNVTIENCMVTNRNWKVARGFKRAYLIVLVPPRFSHRIKIRVLVSSDIKELNRMETRG